MNFGEMYSKRCYTKEKAIEDSKKQIGNLINKLAIVGLSFNPPLEMEIEEEENAYGISWKSNAQELTEEERKFFNGFVTELQEKGMREWNKQWKKD